MPATYRHVHTYEQIAGKSRNARNKPEQPKLVERSIFGIDVDIATFRKYDRNDYSFGGMLHNLLAVDVWASSRELAEEFPEKAAEARKIKEQIIAEITGKDIEIMKTPRTAADFIDALNNIYSESRAAYDTLQNKVDQAKNAMDKAYENMRDPSGRIDPVAEARYTVAKGEYQIAEHGRQHEYNQMITGYEKRVKELREQFAEHLGKHYAASPDKLDTATMQLLSSGICTPSELARLIDRHQDNPTMLRIVGQYARDMREKGKNTLSYDDLVICSNVARSAAAAKDGSRELAIFDSAVSTAAYGLGRDYNHASRMHSHAEGWFEGFKQNMNNLPVIPEEMALAASKEE